MTNLVLSDIIGKGKSMTFPLFIMNEYPHSKSQFQFTLSDGGDETLNLEKTPVIMNETKNHLWKYDEDKILKDVEDYVTSTYGSHYCGHNQVYKDTQTIDLMAAKDLACLLYTSPSPRD